MEKTVVISPEELEKIHNAEKEIDSRAQMEALCKGIDKLLLEGETHIDIFHEFRYGWKCERHTVSNCPVSLSNCYKVVSESIKNTYSKRGWDIKDFELKKYKRFLLWKYIDEIENFWLFTKKGK